MPYDTKHLSESDPSASSMGLAGLTPTHLTCWTDDAYHVQRTPGAYEWWNFEAIDQAGNGVVVTLFEGLPFHPYYQAAMARWNRHGRKAFITPPSDALASYYPAAYMGVYQGGARVAQFLNLYPHGSFEGHTDQPEIRVGPNRVTLRADGSFGIIARGYPFEIRGGIPKPRLDQVLSATLNFAPTFTGVQHIRPLRPQGRDGSHHHWVLAAPHGRMTGRIQQIAENEAVALLDLPLNAAGYHDHMYGQGPLGSGVRQFVWGHAVGDKWTVAWQRTHMLGRPSFRSEVILLFEADRHPMIIESPSVSSESIRTTRWLVHYAGHSTLHGSDAKGNSAELLLDQDQVVERSPFHVRLTGRAALTLAGKGQYVGRGTTTVMQLRRLRWPLVSDVVLMSIVSVPTDDPLWRQ